MASLSGKIIVVTGAGSGIGQATAQVLASRGALVSLGDINKAGLDETLKILSGEGHFGTVVDVSNHESVDAWIEETTKRLGGLHGAANVAGVEREGLRRLADSRDEDWDFTMNVNAKGVFFCMRAQLRKMLKGGGGSIVNISSAAGIRGYAEIGIYTASKHAVHGLSKSAAREYGNENIRVNVVAPGAIDTPMNKDVVDPDYSAQAMNRWASATEVANVIAFLLSDDASFITGAIYPVDGGATT